MTTRRARSQGTISHRILTPEGVGFSVERYVRTKATDFVLTET
jgi:hypothetical protein